MVSFFALPEALLRSRPADGFQSTGTLEQYQLCIVRCADLVHKVDNFQPYYTFNPRHMEDLQLGATILRDHLDLQSEKKAKAEFAAKNAKAAQEEAATKVRLSDLLEGSFY